MSPRNTPVETIEEMFENMSQQFAQAAEAWETGDSVEYFQPGFKTMAVDVLERDDEYVVTVDIPGFERDDIDVMLHDATLTIEAERDLEFEEEEENYLRRERQYGSLTRSIHLPDAIDPEDVAATMESGELTITVPRAGSEESGQEIPIAGE